LTEDPLLPLAGPIVFCKLPMERQAGWRVVEAGAGRD